MLNSNQSNTHHASKQRTEITSDSIARLDAFSPLHQDMSLIYETEIRNLPRNDEILGSILNPDRPIRIHDRQISRVVISAKESFLRRFRVVVVFPHDDISSDNNLA